MTAERPRDDEIRAVIAGTWAEAGIEEADVWRGDWSRQLHDTGRCASLPDGDRWYARRDSRVPGERYPQLPVFDGARRYLEREGFDLRCYRAPLSGALELRAHRGDVTVIFDVSTNGAAFVEVLAGPCAPFIADGRPSKLQLFDPSGSG